MTQDTQAQSAFELAVSHHQAGRLAEAEKGYHEILESEPGHAGALQLLGMIRHQTGNSDLAVKLIAKAVAIAPDYAEAHNNLGNVLKKQGRLDEAMACYRRCIEIAPDYAMAHNNLGNVLTEQGKLDEAIACYRKSLELVSDYSVAHYNLGNALRDTDRPEEAVEHYRRALEITPDYALAHNNLGNLLKDQGKFDQALACYRRALEVAPNYAVAHNNLGNVLKERGKLDEAVAAYRRALEIAPRYAMAHNNLGNVLKEQGKFDEAVAAYRRALEIAPGYAMAHGNLGNALKEQGKLDEAVACFRQAVEFAPDNATAHSNLGDALWVQGELNEAIVACNRAIELDSAFAMAHFNLGKTLQAAGTLEAAAASYKRTIECDPGLLEAHFGLAAILNTTGRQAEGRRVLEQGVRRQPIATECTAKGEPRATILKLVGLRGTVLNIKEGRSRISGAYFDTSFLIDSEKFTVHRYHILEDNLSNAAKADLPPHDIVLNGIIDPDVEPASLNTAQAFIARQGAPFINDPAKVRLTSRDKIYRLLTGIDNLVVPKVVRETLAANDPSLFMPVVEKHGLRFPLIVRPVGGHVGYGMVKIDDIADFENVTFPRSDLEFYLIEFHDFQGDDGYYWKMRVFFVDGKIYPRHLLISDQWKIHASARQEFMQNNAWMMDEENSFLEDPDAYLGQRNCSALEEIDRRIGLDVFGVDYAMLPNGKLLLFEANAAMRVTMDDWHADFPYKIWHTNKIKTAFEEMMLARIGGSFHTDLTGR